MKKCNVNKRKQRGFSLFELLLVVSIIAALTVALVYTLGSRASQRSKTRILATQIAEIAKSQQEFIASPEHTEFSSSIIELSQLGDIPKNLVKCIRDQGEPGVGCGPFKNGYSTKPDPDKSHNFLVTMIDVGPEFTDDAFHALYVEIAALNDEEVADAETDCKSEPSSSGGDGRDITCSIEG